MAKKSAFLVVLGLAALMAGSYFGIQQFGTRQSASSTLQQLELPDINKDIRKGEEWLGKVVIVNHWATWCAPCREEIPMLIDYHQQMQASGVQVVGIAHDTLPATRIFSDEVGISYPSLWVIDGAAELLIRHGNKLAGALPFTAIFDRNGKLVQTKLGIISVAQLNAWVKPLL